MTSKRQLRRDVEELSDTSEERDRTLRQEIPYESLKEWEEFSGHDMSWIEDLEGVE